MKSIRLLALLLFMLSFTIQAETWKIKHDNNISLFYHNPCVINENNVIFGAERQGELVVLWSSDACETFDRTYSEWNTNPYPAMPLFFNYIGDGHCWTVLKSLLGDYSEIRHNRNMGYGKWDTLWIPNETISKQYKPSIQSFKMYDSVFGGGSIIMDVTGAVKDDATYTSTDILFLTDDGWQTNRYLRIDTIFNEQIYVGSLYFVSREQFHFLSEYAYYVNNEDSSYKPENKRSREFIYSTFDGGNTWERFNVSNLFPTGASVGISDMKWIDSKTGWVLGYWEEKPIYKEGVGNATADQVFILKSSYFVISIFNI